MIHNIDKIFDTNNQIINKQEYENYVEELKLILNIFLHPIITEVINAMILHNGCCTEKELSEYFKYTRSAIAIRLKSMNQWIITDPSLKVKKNFYSQKSNKNDFSNLESLNKIGKPIFLRPLPMIFILILKRMIISLAILDQMQSRKQILDVFTLELIYHAMRFIHPLPIFFANVISENINILSLKDTRNFFSSKRNKNYFPDLTTLNLEENEYNISSNEAILIWKNLIDEYLITKSSVEFKKNKRNKKNGNNIKIYDYLINNQPYLIVEEISKNKKNKKSYEDVRIKIPDLKTQFLHLTNRFELYKYFLTTYFPIASTINDIIKISKPTTQAPRIYKYFDLTQMLKKFYRTLDYTNKVTIILNNPDYYLNKFIIKIRNYNNLLIHSTNTSYYMYNLNIIVPINYDYSLTKNKYPNLQLNIINRNIPKTISNLVVFIFPNNDMKTLLEFSHRVNSIYKSYYIMDPENVESILKELSILDPYI